MGESVGASLVGGVLVIAGGIRLVTGQPERQVLRLIVDRGDFFRDEVRRKNHLQHFYVVAMAEFTMTNGGRLMYA